MEFQSGAVRPVGNIQDGWAIIKDDYWTFFGMTLVAGVIVIIVAIILGTINNLITFGISAALGMATNNGGDTAKISASIVPQLISMVISLFTNIIVGALSGVLFCGIYKALSNKIDSGAANFGDLFGGFQKFSSCLIVATVVALVQFVLSLAMLLGGAALGVSVIGSGMITRDGQLNPALFGGLFLVALAFGLIYLIINLIIGALTTFAYPLIGDRDLPGGQALTLSIKAGFANLGGLILMSILLGLMLFGGALLCLVGILFVAPIFSAAIFSAYQSVFGRAAGSFQQVPPPPPTFNNQPGYGY